MAGLRESNRDQLINCFRMCHIFKQDVPSVLCTLFKEKIAHRGFTVNKETIDGQELITQERFLSLKLKEDLKNGRIDEWDITLLKKLLLFSSQLLLVDSFDDQASLEKGNRLITRLELNPGDVILYNRDGRLLRNEVEAVEDGYIILQNGIKKVPPQFSVYLCSKEWVAVEELSKLRNWFAHLPKCHIGTTELTEKVKEIKGYFQSLIIDQIDDCITNLDARLTETYNEYSDDVLRKEIRDCQANWFEKLKDECAEIKEGQDKLDAKMEKGHAKLNESLREIGSDVKQILESQRQDERGQCKKAKVSSKVVTDGISSIEEPKKKPIKLGELAGDLMELAYKWNSLGIQLGLEPDKLSKIQENFGGPGSANKVDNCFAYVLDTWRQGDFNNFNRETLVEALKVIDHSDLAEVVRKDIPNEAEFKKLRTQHFCQLLAECKAQYSVLGVQLGVSLDRIEEIEKMSGPGDCSLCLQKMLQLYLRNKKADLKKLCAALVYLDMTGLSERLQEKYKDREFISH